MITPLLNRSALAGLLGQVKTVAVVGAKDVTGQPVDTVGRYLLQAGFTVVPVHPKRKTVWGLTAYPSLLDVPTPVDMVNLFRAPQFCAEHARECLQMQPPPKVFWMQSGIRSPEARAILEPAGIQVIEDACVMVERRALFT